MVHGVTTSVRACLSAITILLWGALGCDRGAPSPQPPPVGTVTVPATGLPALLGAARPESAPEVPPVARPTTTRSSAPATAPATSQAVVPAFQPLLNVTEGEWAEYEALGSMSLRYDVEKATVATVATRVTVRDRGKPLGLPAVREDPRDQDFLAREAAVVQATRSATRARMEATGRLWSAMLYEEQWLDEDVRYVRRTWVSDAVPVFGIIRMELRGDGQLEARLELTAYGPQ